MKTDLNIIIEKIEKMEMSFERKISKVPDNLSESMKYLWIEKNTKWHKVRFRNLYRKYEILMLKRINNL